ncbi:MAG: rRNA cytosine-C5-methyltransferase [Muribaculaceae bacterium]|nr:rRNA cytosine-C5-methyltransferase [Muribaculaceae bacterium]
MDLDARFVEMLGAFGEEYAAPLLAALDTAPAVSVRANTLKGSRPTLEADLVPWCEAGFYLPERPLFAADPAWHQGLYYVQDASSMVYGTVVADIVRRFMPAGASLRYLDACAAPGGKTTAALEALPAGTLVVANELDRHRSNILLENVTKEGSPSVVVSRGDAAAFGALTGAFDIIAVDAPCSGEGMMRKEPEAVRQWSPALIEQCAAIQRDILAELWSALRPGGVLIYSTCTFNRSENEANVERLVADFGAESIDLGLDSYPGVWHGFGTQLHCYRFAPGHVRGEGLFIAALRKPGQGEAAQAGRAPKAVAVPEVAAWLADPSAFVLTKDADTITALPATHAAFIAELGRKVHLLRAGLPVATLKGRDYAPTHELAVSTALKPEAFARLELDYRGAIAYLRGESLADIPAGLPKGYVTVCFGGSPMGLAKNIGRRANNLFPDHLRLRIAPRTEAPLHIIR